MDAIPGITGRGACGDASDNDQQTPGIGEQEQQEVINCC